MTKDEKQHKSKLAQLGCMACLRIHGAHEAGPVELHHLRTGGWGKGKGVDRYMGMIPLCVEHHTGMSGIHGMGTKAFDSYYPFTQRDLLADALRLVAA